MTKNIFRVAAFVAVFAFLLGACTSSNNEDSLVAEDYANGPFKVVAIASSADKTTISNIQKGTAIGSRLVDPAIPELGVEYTTSVPFYIDGAFVEWNTEADGTGVAVTQDYIVNKNQNIYAIYEGSIYNGLASGGIGKFIKDGEDVYEIHTYTSGTGNLTFTADQPTSSELLVVAGGGGGGANDGTRGGGGGGAGGLIHKTSFSIPSKITSVNVGEGGSNEKNDDADINMNGEDSSFGNEIAKGGGAGGHGNFPNNAGRYNGNSGGSGGGGGYSSQSMQGTPGAGYLTQGYAGGNNSAGWGGSAGGGAGGSGQNTADNTTLRNGAPGLDINITGTSVGYAGGGAGGLCKNNDGSGATVGVGTHGAGGTDAEHLDGAPNTGGGGGGSFGKSSLKSGNIYLGGRGGSGIVAVRWIVEPTILTDEPEPEPEVTEGDGE
ncbi:MAG: hypothetical protein Ta2B_25440 [Termitinemataceae bacterium]|nr:MAG: hypothetical protein Ta2B_25440 [Termitinemataceae bacterium]